MSGYGYYKPFYNVKFFRPGSGLISAAKNVMMQEECPNHQVSEAMKNVLHGLIELVDFDKHCTEAPVHMLHAYWLTKANQV